MAIEKMKKLRLVAVKSEREELLKRLMLLGCVEISEPDKILDDEETAPLLTRESAGASQCQSEYTMLREALQILDKYAPAKTGLLSPKPEISVQAVMNNRTLEKTLETAKTINLTDDKIRRIEVEESHVRGVLESLEPWKSLDMPLDLSETASCFLLLGVIPVALDLKTIRAELDLAAGECELISVSDDKDMHYLLLVAMKEKRQEVMEVLRKYSFAQSSVSELRGTADENIAKLTKQLAEHEKKKAELTARIAAFKGERDELKLCSDRMLTKLGQAENGEKLLCTEKSVIFEGWFPAKREKELASLLSKFDCAWEADDPAPDEYPEVPVQLTNGRAARPLNMVTNMYSLPAYDNVDPNPLMAPFFILFYGAMMADVGYGLLMIAVSLLVLKKKKPSGTTRDLFELMFEGGISTLIWGFFTGGFFGNLIPTLAESFFNTPADALPQWLQAFNRGILFNPLDDTLLVLVGAMVLGFIQVITGTVISFVEKAKKGHVMDGVWDEGSWWVIFIGLALMVLKVGNVGGVPVVLLLGCLMLIIGAGRNAKGFGKITAVFGAVYNGVTGYFSDILSYSRIMALMLAGSVIAQVFNTLGAIPGNIIVFILIFLIGHTLNFGLNLLGCYVHDLRLQCLEYFGKFYKDGGRAFKPMSVNTEYYDIVK